MVTKGAVIVMFCWASFKTQNPYPYKYQIWIQEIITLNGGRGKRTGQPGCNGQILFWSFFWMLLGAHFPIRVLG